MRLENGKELRPGAGDNDGWNADVTPEAVAHMRKLAARVMDSQEWASTTVTKPDQPDED